MVVITCRESFNQGINHALILRFKSARTLDIEIKGSRLIIFTQKFLQGFHFLYRSFKVKWNTVGVGAKNDFMGEINFGFANKNFENLFFMETSMKSEKQPQF